MEGKHNKLQNKFLYSGDKTADIGYISDEWNIYMSEDK
jgi:hypothetical protein